MAEQVQFILERMVPPLKDLRTRGLFTPDEIRSIVDRRRQSEYLLQRRGAVRKSDYLRYIEHEIMLERLRKLRKEKVLTEMKNNRRQEDDDDSDANNKNHKKHAFQTSGPGDSHILSHIHFLYQRTLKKFHYPLDIVLNYAEFSKEHKSFQMLSRIYAEGLQFHPRESGLWIEAASFEYFGYVAQDYQDTGKKGKKRKQEQEANSKVVGSSIQNARVLMQRGLRINKKSVDLWLQYFSLELHYVQKLRGRREILGNGDEESSNEEQQGEDGKKISTALLPSEIIFKNAIKAISDNIQFRLRFVEACRMFPRTKQLEEYIMKSVTEDFGESVEGWVARISYAEEQLQKKGEGGNDETGFLVKADDNGNDGPTKKARVESESKTKNDPALTLLQEALEAVPTPKMYLEGARFLRLRITRLLDDKAGNDDDEDEDENLSHLIGKEEDAKGAAQRHTHILEALYENANKMNASSTDLTLDHVIFLLSTGELQNAEQLLSSTVATGDANDTRLWLRWAEISQRMEAELSDGSMVPASSSSPTLILRRALQCTPLHDRQAHTLILTKLMHHLMMEKSLSLKGSEELKSLFQKLILLSQGSNYSISSIVKTSDDDEDDNGEEIEVNLASTFNAYLKYTVLNSTKDATEKDDAARSIYTSVIYHSNYGKSCSGKTEEEQVAMKSFFDLCVQCERTANSNTNLIGAKGKKGRKETKNASKMHLCKLYQAAIGFYESSGGGGGDGGVWKRNVVDGYQRDFEDVKYSF